jgi:hypothetical protein
MVASSLGSVDTGSSAGCRRLVPAATWGTSQFRGCEWCRRDRDCPNPIIKELRVNPTLKFRSERHLMCNPCSGSLRQSEPVLLLPGNAADKTKRKVRVKTNDDGYDSHCALVEKYEDQMNGKTPRTLKSRKRKGGDDEGEHGSCDEDHDKAVAVSSTHGTELSARTLLGILWSPTLFEDAMKRKPSKKEVVSLTIGGKTCTGVLRDPKHGTPRGSTEVWQTAFAKAESQTALSSSSSQLREGETEDWYKAAAQAVSFSTKDVGEGDEATLALRGGSGSSSKKTRAEDDLDLTWDTGVDVEDSGVHKGGFSKGGFSNLCVSLVQL